MAYSGNLPAKGNRIIPARINLFPAKNKGVSYFRPVFISAYTVDQSRQVRIARRIVFDLLFTPVKNRSANIRKKYDSNIYSSPVDPY